MTSGSWGSPSNQCIRTFFRLKVPRTSRHLFSEPLLWTWTGFPSLSATRSWSRKDSICALPSAVVEYFSSRPISPMPSHRSKNGASLSLGSSRVTSEGWTPTNDLTFRGASDLESSPAGASEAFTVQEMRHIDRASAILSGPASPP